MADKSFEQKAFNYTLEGMADEVGIIARGSAANPDNNGLNSKKEKKQREFLRTLNELQRWLDKEIERLENSVKGLKMKIEATQRLFEAYRERQPNFDSPEFIALIQVSGMDRNEIESFEALDFEKYLNTLKNDLKKDIDKLQRLKDINVSPENVKKQEIQAAIDSGAFTDENVKDVIEDISAKADTNFDLSSFNQLETPTPQDDLTTTSIDPGFSSKDHFSAVANPPNIKENVEFEIKRPALNGTVFKIR